MRALLAAFVVASLGLAGCGDDGGSDATESTVDVNSETAQQYLAELDDAGFGDVFESDEAAVAYVAGACANAASLGKTPEELVTSEAVEDEVVIALELLRIGPRGLTSRADLAG